MRITDIELPIRLVIRGGEKGKLGFICNIPKCDWFEEILDNKSFPISKTVTHVTIKHSREEWMT